jgi:predicted dehydrogenase
LIVSIGAGGIVRNAHMPAYQKSGFQLHSVYDPNQDNAKSLAKDFGIKHVAESLPDLIVNAPQNAIFDLAIPASGLAEVLPQLPDESYVLMQKPMGETLLQAENILQICQTKRLHAAVNFQLRWAPYVLALKEIITRGALGDVYDLDFKINVYTPWQLWTFLEKAPRMEMVYHSIHYIDLVRDVLGEPNSVMAKSIKHHLSPKLESSRSAIIFDYGDFKRATIHTNHGHRGGAKHQESYLKVEGTQGIAKIQMGLNMNYPDGAGDYLELWTESSDEWVSIPFEGSWFPDAFCGPMQAMIDWQNGGDPPSTVVNNAMGTMRWVDAAYRSSDQGGIV